MTISFTNGVPSCQVLKGTDVPVHATNAYGTAKVRTASLILNRRTPQPLNRGGENPRYTQNM